MSDDLPADVGEPAAVAALDWLLNRRLPRELEHRVARRQLTVGDVVSRAQALFFTDMPIEVRINEEVHGAMLARPTRDVTAGEEISTDDISSIERYELPEEDRDAAHVTAFHIGDKWWVAWNFTYNANRIGSHIEAGDEFLAVAQESLACSRLRGFAENAFGAAELYAKAELLVLPDERLLRGRHRTLHANYSLWCRLGNSDPHFARLLNELDDLRASARHMKKRLTLEPERAAVMLAQLVRMREHVVAGAPPRGLEEPQRPTRSISVVAHRDLRAGEIVEIPPAGALSLLRRAA